MPSTVERVVACYPLSHCALERIKNSLQRKVLVPCKVGKGRSERKGVGTRM